jgi:hypothetical protein
MASEYVSAEWLEPTFPGGDPVIKAIGDDGLEYFVPSVTTDVPPWPKFLESAAGKAFLETAPPPPEAA